MPIALLLLLNYKVLKIYSYDNSLKSGHQNVKSIVCKVQLQTICRVTIDVTPTPIQKRLSPIEF